MPLSSALRLLFSKQIKEIGRFGYLLFFLCSWVGKGRRCQARGVLVLLETRGEGRLSEEEEVWGGEAPGDLLGEVGDANLNFFFGAEIPNKSRKKVLSQVSPKFLQVSWKKNIA